MKVRLPSLKVFTSKNQSPIFNFVLIFALILVIMPPSIWNGNEEQYLGYAWRRFSPENLLQISALRDTANHRFLFEYLTGFGIEYIGFEWTHALGRIIVALLYSASLISLFRNLGLSFIAGCTILLSFVWLGEDILGGEWLFKGVEPKTLAYPFVFFSFSSSLKKRFGTSYLLLSLATYFHFLVGGFWFLVTWLGQLYWTRNLKQTLLDSLKYFIPSIPLFFTIAIGQLQAQETINSIPSASWIYSHFRASHHVAPFASLKQFKTFWYEGVFFLGGLTIASVVVYRSGNRNEKEFSKLILALNLYFVISLLFSYFDKNGVLGKLYLFRPSSITLFLTLCLYALVLKNRIAENLKEISFVTLILISSLTLPILEINSLRANIGLAQSPSSINNSKLEKIIQSSNNTDIFLIDPNLEDDSELKSSMQSFERKYNRPTLVSYKFVPTTNSDIVRWYELLKMRKDLFKKGCPSEITSAYKIRYLLAARSNNKVKSCGNVVYSKGRVKLIELTIN